MFKTQGIMGSYLKVPNPSEKSRLKHPLAKLAAESYQVLTYQYSFIFFQILTHYSETIQWGSEEMADCIKMLVTKPNGLSSILSLQGPPCRRELTLMRCPFTSKCHCACTQMNTHTHTIKHDGAVYSHYPSLASYCCDKD